MLISNLRTLLSAASIVVAAGATTASAAVVDLYQITVKGTFQSQVDAGFPPQVFVSNPEWSPVFGKSVELTFSMPGNQVPDFFEMPNAVYDGEIFGRFDGSVLSPSDPSALTSLFLGGGTSRHTVSVFGSFAGSAFGLPNFEQNIFVSISLSDDDAMGIDLSEGLPRDLSRSIFENQSIRFSGQRALPNGGSMLLTVAARVDSVTVTPAAVAPVPLPASALLLGIGLAGLGALGRRQRAG